MVSTRICSSPLGTRWTSELSCCPNGRQVPTSCHNKSRSQTTMRPNGKHLEEASRGQLVVKLTLVAMLVVLARTNLVESHPESQLRFDSESGSYQGLTFTFDPRLDKQVEQQVHFEHWLSVMQHASGLLYETLNGRAHLAEIKVLIPFKWRQLSAELRPGLYKPGAPVIANRRLRWADSDVIVGLEDPIYKETPFAVQHDECGRPGLNIRMPISFLDQHNNLNHLTQREANYRPRQQLDARLKARQFVREFASLRYGIFKESGFRSDFMYPPFSSVPGLGPLEGAGHRWLNQSRRPQLEQPTTSSGVNASEQADYDGVSLKGFDEHFRECEFDTSPASGLPANAQAANCLPYLVRADKPLGSLNLMSADPFSYVPASGGGGGASAELPVHWNELAEQTKWHFCGENFANPNYSPAAAGAATQLDQTNAVPSSITTTTNKLVHYEHNQKAANKQNRMCQERSALEVIRTSEDFSQPARFLQEMPPRLIMCIEYTSHLFQSRRLDHPILESAINKFLALDLIAESELATVVFGQHQSRSSEFEKLESSLKSRHFSPANDPFDEQVQFYSQSELFQLGAGQSSGAIGATAAGQQQQPVRILKGSCSLAKMMAEVNGLLKKSSMQYDDIGADLIVLTSGLFVEDEARIEEILRSSNFKLENNRLSMIIYPATMLFDTKSRDGLVVLDSNESELVIRSRVNKLLLIQRLTGGKLHLIREQLDSSGDVKMSTLTQFYQIFDHLAKGHSWDQTGSLIMLQSQQVDSRQSQQQSATNQHKLTFQFNLDESVQNELIVGFIDTKVEHQTSNLVDRLGSQTSSAGAPHKATGKRFSLKNLQLRSPGGQFVFTETNSTWNAPLLYGVNTGDHHYNQSSSSYQSSDELHQLDNLNQDSAQKSAFFPLRSQLSLAAFHVKQHQLSRLMAVDKLAGTWTLSALSDEPIQTSGLAMARANSQGDTLMGNCWFQAYTRESIFEAQSSQDEQNSLKMVKVFAQINGGVGNQRQEVEARMELQDEMGNIVQNVQMLDDGLGAPDMTQNDGIFSQYIQRATRSGFYKISVKLTTGSLSSSAKLPVVDAPSGQDNVCCGSFVPNSNAYDHSSHYQHTPKPIRSTRQLYCGTFYVEPKNKLAHQRPPRISNLTVVNVDQDNRQVTLRWFEPKLDISSNSRPLMGGPLPSQLLQFDHQNQLVPISSESDLIGDEAQQAESSSGQQRRASRSTRLTPLSSSSSGNLIRRQIEEQEDQEAGYDDQLGRNVLMASHQQQQQQQPTRSILPLANQIDRSQSGPTFQSRYEIKLFFDRDITKRTFDAKDVAFKFDEWSVEGQFPNASQFGGMKEVTLRVPFAREGFYFIAMKVYNNIGLSSQMSNVVQFYLRNNMTREEMEAIFNQPGTRIDAEGNVYDQNGDLVQRAGSALTNQLSSGTLFKGKTALDGLSLLILISVLVFMMVVLCITLVACLANSARHSLKTSAANKASRQHNNDDNPKKIIGSMVDAKTGANSAGSGSSMVSSGGCESSEVGACSGSSSLAGSCSGGNNHNHQQQLVEGSHLLFDELTSYNKLQQQHKSQQQQAQMIQQQLMSSKDSLARQQQEFYSHPQDQQQQQNYVGPNHTIVNGYTYATVLQSPQNQRDHYQSYEAGDLNQNGLVAQQALDPSGVHTSAAVINPVQSWPADVLLNHYDKVKQARERNEAPPVMRIETLEHNNGLQYSDGLPAVFDNETATDHQAKANQYSSLGEQHATYYNQQLHQQLSSVLKFKRQNLDYNCEIDSSSPALDGITSELMNGNENDQTSAMPPPPHYLFNGTATGPPVDCNGLGNLHTDPSIYSQVTNLQQVSSPPNNIHDDLNSYYANQQHQWASMQTGAGHNASYGGGQQSASMISSGIYSPSNVERHQENDATISEV